MQRRLYRSETDRMIAGVCGGLADYFDIDPTLVRIVFVVLFFLNGIGLLLYIIMALVVPRESAVRLSPKEVIRDNVEDLGETARKVAQDVKKTLGRTGASETPEEEQTMPTETETPTTPTPVTRREAHRRRGILAGIILILLGLIFLGQNLGLFWWWDWDIIWPLILIAVGIYLLVRRVQE